MTTPAEGAEGPTADDCTERRSAVETLCAEAHVAQAAHEETSERLRQLRRDHAAEEHALAAAENAAQLSLRTQEKASAREAFERARGLAQTEEEQNEATATWARALDRINRSGRLAQRAVTDASAALADLEAGLREAEREEQTSRIRAEQAEAACLDARVRLAACEEGAAAPDPEATATAFDPHAATGGHAVAISEAGVGVPLVIESMVSGDRRALELAATQIAEHTGLSPAEAQLQLQELVDAIVSSAADEGFLVFDTRHPFWSTLSFDEARDVIAALARLGFLFEPSEGWHAGRAPAPSDLSMALAYAGLDARNMRDLPSAEDLRLLPRSIGVDGRAFLAAQAPDLTVDHVVHILDRRAAALEPLWDEWGQVRPILLSDRHTLGSVPG